MNIWRWASWTNFNAFKTNFFKTRASKSKSSRCGL